MSNVLHIETDDDFDSFLKENKDKLIVVDFFATWCGPCKKIAPAFEALSADRSALYVKVDVDKLEETAKKYDVTAMPTFIVIKNGERVDTVVGASIENVEAVIRKHK
uniref:Thioredoxin n=1 Tax=Schistosoma japonicum TaxID=6182 RepID=C1LQT3_SCHJA|nr:thioredoxin 1 [Schistosoma japonicum]CAX77061.1 thioredoxin 1 [Schistosoma japonicum]